MPFSNGSYNSHDHISKLLLMDFWRPSAKNSSWGNGGLRLIWLYVTLLSQIFGSWMLSQLEESWYWFRETCLIVCVVLFGSLSVIWSACVFGFVCVTVQKILIVTVCCLCNFVWFCFRSRVWYCLCCCSYVCGFYTTVLHAPMCFSLCVHHPPTSPRPNSKFALRFCSCIHVLFI